MFKNSNILHKCTRIYYMINYNLILDKVSGVIMKRTLPQCQMEMDATQCKYEYE